MKYAMQRTNAIQKVLSANDVGMTGAHQAGILIPKALEVLSFFADLGNNELNPRVILTVFDPEGNDWRFAFIYYNNKYFGGGTRNEYRLTRMTPYIKQNNLKAGDKIILKRDENDRLMIEYRRATSTELANGTLRIGSTWKVVEI